MFYLFVGEDYFSKDKHLEKIKRQFFSKDVEFLNYDVLFAQDLTIEEFQEALKRLPQDAKKRIVLIREADFLKGQIRDYICTYIKKQFPKVILILDFREFNKKDKFVQFLLRYTKPFYFHPKEILDTFRLAKEIEHRRIKTAFKILHNLLLEGTKPETILGGLRYSWQNSNLSVQEKTKRLSLLLEADLSIKTGKLKPVLALEKLLFSLCCF